MTLRAVIAALRQFYGRLPDPPRDPFGYFVWEVLSSETVPARRDAAFAALKKIPALTPDAMHRAPPAKVSAALALAGPYRDQRLDALHVGVDRFRRGRLADVIRGPLPRARRALKPVPRLGEGAIRRLLFFGGNHAIVPTDARLVRVVARLAVVPAVDNPKQRHRLTRQLLRTEFDGDPEALRAASSYLTHHAAATCLQREPHCGVCPVARECHYRLSVTA